MGDTCPKKGKVIWKEYRGTLATRPGSGKDCGDGSQGWARLCAHWKDGARGLLRWDCVIGSGATNSLPFELTESILCFHHKNQFGPHLERLVFPPQKPVRTSQRKSCVPTTNTSSNFTKKVAFQQQKPVWTSPRTSCVSTTKPSSDRN
jgi:hypothetical protein